MPAASADNQQLRSEQGAAFAARSFLGIVTAEQAGDAAIVLSVPCPKSHCAVVPSQRSPTVWLI
jgi:hypothetical protein